MSWAGSRWAERRSSSVRKSEWTKTDARVCTWAWICTCHWSGTVSFPSGDLVEQGMRRRRGREHLAVGAVVREASRHSAAQMMVPPGRTTAAAAEPPGWTTAAAADMPFTAWYRF